MNRTLRYVVMAAAFAGGMVLVASAQTPAAPATKGGAPASTAASAPAATPTVVPPVAPTTAPAAAVSPERFEPTDKVRADFDVSFPIDI